MNDRKMDFETFHNSLSQSTPPADLSNSLQALWQDAKNSWQAAHDLVDGTPGTEAAWIHAYLHRKEGDTWNADYWYRRANRVRPDVSLDQEWEAIAKELLR